MARTDGSMTMCLLNKSLKKEKTLSRNMYFFPYFFGQETLSDIQAFRSVFQNAEQPFHRQRDMRLECLH